jgi:hydroxymethylpyrimidine pyrophosphatase-like HAD family hydrolase
MPYQPFQIDRLRVLADYSRSAGLPGTHAEYPAFSICSGRAYPYVEAMSQLLHVQTPVLFEAGAGMFDPVTARLTWHPSFTEAIRLEIDDIRRFMEGVALRGRGLSIDYAKRSQAAMVGSPGSSLDEARIEVNEFVRTHHPSFNSFHTHISIDVVPAGLTKAEGMFWMAETCGISVDEIAFIGDTGGDVGALGVVGSSFAPANGSEDARAAARHVSAFKDIDAVIEAYMAVCVGS